MKKLIFIFFILSYNFCYPQWEITNWRGDPEIYDIFVHDNTILIRARKDLMISNDYGNEWKSLNQQDLVSEGIVSVAFIDNNIFISTVFGGVYLSDDNGNSWRKRNNGLLNRSYVKLYSDGNLLYAGTFGGGVFVSFDFGKNWQVINNGLNNLNVIQIAVKEQTLVASTPDGMYVSTNSGQEWKLKNNGIPIDDYNFDEICFFDGNIIISSHGDTYGSYENIIYSSSDSGETWVKRNNSIIADIYTYSLLSTSDAIIVEDFENLYYSIDTCKTWLRINIDAPFECGVGAINSYHDSIYIAFGGELFTLKKDWNKRKKLFTGLKCGKIESMITYNNKIFIGAHYGWLCESMGKIYSTSDYGITWDTVIKPFINVLSLAASKNIIVAGTQYNTCYISTDSGKNFQSFDTQDSIFEWDKLSSAAIIDTNIIVCVSSLSGYKGLIFISSDYGNTWLEKVPGLTGIHVLSLTVKDDNMFAATEMGVYLSTDMGANWILRNNGIPDNLQINTIEINGENIIAGTNDGVYQSTNMGLNWQQRNDGLPNKSVVRKIIFSGDNIFICNWGNGVYMTSNLDKRWIQKNDGLDNLRVSTFAIIDNYLFVGTNSTVSGTVGNDAIFKAKLSDLITDVDDNQEISKTMISPNPATDYITINPGNKGLKPFAETDEKVEIYNSFGELILKDVPHLQDVSHLNPIDVSHLPVGLYFVKIGNRIEKFAKI